MNGPTTTYIFLFTKFWFLTLWYNYCAFDKITDNFGYDDDYWFNKRLLLLQGLYWGDTV